MDSLLAVCFQVFARSTSVIVAVINMIICLRKVLRNLTARFVQNLLKKIKSVHIGGLLFFSFSIVGSISLLSMVPSRRHWRICFSQELLIWISWGLLRYRNVRHAIENTVFYIFWAKSKVMNMNYELFTIYIHVLTIYLVYFYKCVHEDTKMKLNLNI